MSLDVTITLKERKNRCRGTEPCGSTVAIGGEEHASDTWYANITHNMTDMAKNVPVSYHAFGEKYSNSLYQMVWRPEEVGDELGTYCVTDIIADALEAGIAYMVGNREELLQYNPENNWGDYWSFLKWLIEYWRACVENPGCKIEVSR